jgi:hypothetical protein
MGGAVLVSVLEVIQDEFTATSKETHDRQHHHRPADQRDPRRDERTTSTSFKGTLCGRPVDGLIVASLRSRSQIVAASDAAAASNDSSGHWK